MGTNLPANSAVRQMQRVQQGSVVASVAGACDKGLYSRPVASRTIHTRQRRIDLEPWPPAEHLLPDAIGEIERGRPEPPAAGRDNTREGRLRRLTGGRGG